MIRSVKNGLIFGNYREYVFGIVRSINHDRPKICLAGISNKRVTKAPLLTDSEVHPLRGRRATAEGMISTYLSNTSFCGSKEELMEISLPRSARSAGAATETSVDTAALLVVSSRGVAVRVVGSGVDTDGDEGQEAILEAVADEDVVDEGVVVGGGLAGGDAVAGGEDEALGVGAVGAGLLDGGDELLVEEDLADVVRLADDVRLVGQDLGVLADEQVDVVRAALVVAREDGVELGHAVAVRLLDAAQEGRVQAALAAGRDARVDADGVAVPDVDECLGDGGVGVDVDELEVYHTWRY